MLAIEIRARLCQRVRSEPDPLRQHRMLSGLQQLSSAGLRLRDVSFDTVEIKPTNRANEAARSIINVNLRNGVNTELLRHRCSPPDDVDLAQRYLRIGLHHLLQAR